MHASGQTVKRHNGLKLGMLKPVFWENRFSVVENWF